MMLINVVFFLFSGLVNSLYPHNPKAVHDRLQDMFDRLDDLKDSQRHIVTSLFHTVGQAHPEVSVLLSHLSQRTC